ncbi:MAG: hypothetical protein QOJ00_761 [Actinomycetota bacterium]|jgi:hypothetical protein
MTTTIDPVILATIQAAPVPYDLFREVHKGLRLALFDLTVTIGSADCTDALARDRVVAGTHALVSLLHSHHGHEDGFVKPVLEMVAPRVSAIVDGAHADVDEALAEIEANADLLGASDGADAVVLGLDLYHRVALFVASYLAHMAYEEGEVMQTLRDALTVAELFTLDMELRASIPLDKLLAFAATMLPAINAEERTAMLGGLRAGAPAEVFEQVRAVAARRLDPQDYRAVAVRLGLN